MEKRPIIAVILQDLIKKNEIIPSHLAKKTGLPVNTIYMILANKVKVPNGSTLLALADYFNVSIDFLLGREGETELDNNLKNNGDQKLNLIPILKLNEVNSWLHGKDKQIKRNIEYTEYSAKGSRSSFALEVNKEYLKDIFKSSNIVIIDPEKKIEDGDYVLLESNRSEPSVWEIRDFSGKRFINPTGIRKKDESQVLDNSIKIYGKVVESRKFYY